MALTKTINYIQTLPVSLGFNNEITGATDPRVVITFNGKAGKLNVGDYGSSVSYLAGNIYDRKFANEWHMQGPLADINAALNDLTWTPAASVDANAVQDIKSVGDLSKNGERTFGDYKGERIWFVGSKDLPLAYSVGDFVGDNDPRYKVVKVLDSERIVVLYNNDFDLVSRQYIVEPADGPISIFDFVSVAKVYIDPADTDLGYRDYNVIEDSPAHVFGNYELDITVYSTASNILTSGTVSLIGKQFVDEPTISAPTQLATDGLYEWSDPLTGTVTQANNELVFIQLLTKRHFNDPTFNGDVEFDKPSYIDNESYGYFSYVRVNRRESESFTSGNVRWQFYGTPAECTKALSEVKVLDSDGKEFFIETRIITNSGRIRIYNTRGYD